MKDNTTFTEDMFMGL